jgi:ABC-type microcin C transport system duplicated ATPase subunit YejF
MSAEASMVERGEATSSGKTPLLETNHVKLYFPVKSGVLIDRTVAQVHAVDDV